MMMMMMMMAKNNYIYQRLCEKTIHFFHDKCGSLFLSVRCKDFPFWCAVSSHVQRQQLLL